MWSREVILRIDAYDSVYGQSELQSAPMSSEILTEDLTD